MKVDPSSVVTVVPSPPVLIADCALELPLFPELPESPDVFELSS